MKINMFTLHVFSYDHKTKRVSNKVATGVVRQRQRTTGEPTADFLVRRTYVVFKFKKYAYAG